MIDSFSDQWLEMEEERSRSDDRTYTEQESAGSYALRVLEYLGKSETKTEHDGGRNECFVQRHEGHGDLRHDRGEQDFGDDTSKTNKKQKRFFR